MTSVESTPDVGKEAMRVKPAAGGRVGVHTQGQSQGLCEERSAGVNLNIFPLRGKPASKKGRNKHLSICVL